MELINQIKKNENILKNMKITENQIKQENKLIPVLKQKINDLENEINQYKIEISELKKNDIKIKKEKEDLNDVININIMPPNHQGHKTFL